MNIDINYKQTPMLSIPFTLQCPNMPLSSRNVQHPKGPVPPNLQPVVSLEKVDVHKSVRSSKEGSGDPARKKPSTSQHLGKVGPEKGEKSKKDEVGPPIRTDTSSSTSSSSSCSTCSSSSSSASASTSLCSPRLRQGAPKGGRKEVENKDTRRKASPSVSRHSSLSSQYKNIAATPGGQVGGCVIRREGFIPPTDDESSTSSLSEESEYEEEHEHRGGHRACKATLKSEKVAAKAPKAKRVSEKEFVCPVHGGGQCFYHRLDSLQRHLRTVHELSKAHKLYVRVSNMGHSRREICPYCSQEYANLAQHKHRCKVHIKQQKMKEKKAKQRSAKKGKGIDLPTDMKSVDEVVDSFIEFLKEGGTTTKTISVYKNAVANFLYYAEDEDAGFRVGAMFSTEFNFSQMLLPVSLVTSYLNELDSGSSGQNTKKGLLKFKMQILNHKMSLVNSMPREWQIEIERNMEDLDVALASATRMLANKSNRVANKNRKDKRLCNSLETRPAAVRNYVRRVLTSPFFQESISALLLSGDRLVAEQQISPNKFRDITLSLIHI